MSETRKFDVSPRAAGLASPSVVIRPSVPADLARVHNIVDAAYRPYVARMGQRPGPMDADYGALIESGALFVAEEGETILGLVVVLEDSNALLLDNVAVAPDRHGRGLGRHLIGFVEDEALKRGRRIVRLYTHETMVENVALYTRLGFVETSRATQHGFRRIFMEKAV
ncbi:GNAT family N-acetyltransferase [Amorphus sp. 3PC139-8]